MHLGPGQEHIRLVSTKRCTIAQAATGGILDAKRQRLRLCDG
jgi:hypothetical protein